MVSRTCMFPSLEYASQSNSNDRLCCQAEPSGGFRGVPASTRRPKTNGSSAGPQFKRMLNGGVKTVFRSTRGNAAIANTWGRGGGGGAPGGAVVG
jgi:hypothetical protein